MGKPAKFHEEPKKPVGKPASAIGWVNGYPFIHAGDPAIAPPARSFAFNNFRNSAPCGARAGQIEFAAAVDSMKIGFIGLSCAEDGFQRESSPRGAELWMNEKFRGRANAEQGVQKGGVWEIEFGRFVPSAPLCGNFSPPSSSRLGVFA